MPELPEVETIARGLARELTGQSIVSVDLRRPRSILGCAPALSGDVFASALAGREVLGVRRRAKLLLMDLGAASSGAPGPREFFGPLVLAVHFKMTGSLILSGSDEAPDRHTHAVFGLSDGRRLFYRDMRKFGWLAAFKADDIPDWKFYRCLGPEPLEISPDGFADLFTGRRARLKGLLLDQRFIAGIGNIYADEALFRAGLAPRRPAHTIGRDKLKQLHAALVEVLGEAIAANGSSIRDYRDSGGNAGAFQNDFRVYGRAGQDCRRCGAALDKTVVAGRTSVFCPKCQK